MPERPLAAPDLERVEVIVAPWWRYDELFQALPRMRALRLVQTMSAGVDRIAPAIPAGVTLCSARGVHDAPVAEWVAAMILADRKRLAEHRDSQREGSWRPLEGDDLPGASVLVVGHGSIGRALAARLEPFGVAVVGVARRPRPGVHGMKELVLLLPEADVVVLLLPLTEQTRGLVGPGFLSSMKPGALLVNAARGAIVDTPALLEALASGRVRAALDVTDPEPLPDGHPLWSAPGAVITPHVAGSAPRFPERAFRFARRQLERYLAGEPLENVVSEGY
jgi:phosphoglycerate dehydrogenase-like enzyme